MEVENSTVKPQFFLLGFSDHPELQSVLFAVFLSIYSVTLMGNLGMILLITASPPLHTPMYFFLCILSFVDACYSSVIAPKLLVDLVSDEKTISYNGCAAQLYFFCCLVDTESFLLTVMAYDRYIAICNPLLYTVIMSKKICCQLAIGAFLGGTMSSVIHTTNTFHLSFCFNTINHFCEFSFLLSLSCSDTYLNQLLLFISATFNEVSTLFIILLSYAFIVVTILKMRSACGRRKAFSTRASRLTAISIFPGAILFLYSVPNSTPSRHTVKVASGFYTVVIPMLNPLIYSLRNKDVKDTVSKIMNSKAK
uniref:Olfactory receptor n=1 Tax=Bos indicus x Bos taurus TaxID=30522 RepID=A0A4W2IDB8_BOBOX